MKMRKKAKGREEEKLNAGNSQPSLPGHVSVSVIPPSPAYHYIQSRKIMTERKRQQQTPLEQNHPNEENDNDRTHIGRQGERREGGEGEKLRREGNRQTIPRRKLNLSCHLPMYAMPVEALITLMKDDQCNHLSVAEKLKKTTERKRSISQRNVFPLSIIYYLSIQTTIYDNPWRET